MNDLWSWFGLKGDPFANADFFESRDYRAMLARMRRGIADREWLLFYGPPGAGKTWWKEEMKLALVDECYFVEVLGGSRAWIRLNNVCDAFCIDLDIESCLHEKPRLALDPRMRQIRRLLGVRSREKEIVLLLDEATHFSDSLMDEIKWLRDFRFGPEAANLSRRDRRPMFTVAAFGWRQLADRIARNPQHKIRVRRHELSGLSVMEIGKFIDALGLTRAVPEATREVLARIAPFPGEIRSALMDGMERALSLGRKQVLPEDILSELQGLSARLRELGIQGRTVAQLANVSDASVSCVLSNRAGITPKLRDSILTAARRLIEEKVKANEPATRAG